MDNIYIVYFYRNIPWLYSDIYWWNVMKTVSVVIASYRSSALLKACIKSLLWEQSVKPLEVIVVVDTKVEAERVNLNFPLLSPFHPDVYYTGKTGPTEARNLGIQKSTGDIIAFIDDDAIAGEDWIKNIIRVFSIGCEVVGGPVSPMFTGGVLLDEKWWWIIGCTSDIPRTYRPISCNMAVSREAFGKYGLFKEVGLTKMKYPMSEETEFVQRVIKNAGTVVWMPNLHVYHDVPKERTTLSYMMTRAYREGVGKSVLQNKDLEALFLKFYLTHPDMYTVPVLASTAYGYIRGKMSK
jgi:glycosyltransferase involved in cell wall biosynthesis